MRELARRVVLNLLRNPVISVTSPGLAQAVCVVVYVSKLAACRCYDVEGEVMSHPVDVVRQLLGVSVRLVLGLCLRAVSRLSGTGLQCGADRDDVHVEVALAALLLAPLCELRVASRDEAESRGGMVGIGQLQGC